MGSSGALILFVSIGLLLVVGMFAMGDIHSQVGNSSSTITEQSNTAVSIQSPIFQAFGYGVLIVGALALLNAFRTM